MIDDDDDVDNFYCDFYKYYYKMLTKNNNNMNISCFLFLPQILLPAHEVQLPLSEEERSTNQQCMATPVSSPTQGQNLTIQIKWIKVLFFVVLCDLTRLLIVLMLDTLYYTQKNLYSIWIHGRPNQGQSTQLTFLRDW